MKRRFWLILAVLLMLSCTFSALAAKAGDTVKVKISVTANPQKAYTGSITIGYDKSALEFVEAQMDSKALTALSASNNTFVLIDLTNPNGISTGVKATVTFKVKSGAVPGKTYNVSASAEGFRCR